jgi:NADH-quinone oxidoreductase subunit E
MSIGEKGEATLLSEKFLPEIEATLAKYPADEKRSAVMPLLFIAQREYGYISEEAMQEIGALIGMSATEVGSLVGFYTLFHDRPGGKYRMQICTDLPCALKGAEGFTDAVCENLGIRIGETTPDGLVTVEEVMCLAACDKAPMFQLQKRDSISYHEQQTAESVGELIKSLKGSGPDG